MEKFSGNRPIGEGREERDNERRKRLALLGIIGQQNKEKETVMVKGD